MPALPTCLNFGEAKAFPVLPTLRTRFGHDTLRDGQEPVIRALLEGRSALAVFPTGGGKSICYQLPALMMDGLTLVVSPLIALMRDQVDALRAKGIAAARWDSTLDAAALAELHQSLEEDAVKILYVAPERFSNEAFRKRLKSLRVALVAIDEAHCISEWGHNFRPDYLKLAKICRHFKGVPVLALTATATPKVARDIRKQFRIAAGDQVQLSFHRPNLYLGVTPCEAAKRKDLLLEKLRAMAGAAVVYVTRQETAEEVATFLAKSGISARAYHAGLPAEFRADAQTAFMEGNVRVMVATIAFGMGIDKAGIRAVFHYNLPKSLENYSQEIGRAGRDGQSADCEMFACADDLIVLENFIHADHPSPRALANLLDRVLRLGAAFDVSHYELSTVCDIWPAVVGTVLAYLELEGFIEATGTFYATYRAKLLRKPDEILNGRPPAERKLVKRLLDAGELKRWWWYFYPTKLAHKFGCSRAKVVTLLTDLAAAGDIMLTASGVRHSYNLKRDPGDVAALASSFTQRFQTRADADLARLRQVLDLSACRGCLTAAVLKYFGEKLDSPCGHCDRCDGLPAKTIRRPKIRRSTDKELQLVRNLAGEKHAALATQRQLARFLCGMASPASTRARLTRHDAFALLADLPFADVLAIAGAFIS